MPHLDRGSGGRVLNIQTFNERGFENENAVMNPKSFRESLRKSLREWVLVKELVESLGGIQKSI